MKRNRTLASSRGRLRNLKWSSVSLFTFLFISAVVFEVGPAGFFRTVTANAVAGPNAPQGFLFTVTTLDDHNDFRCDGTDCTLREAIQAANNTPTEDTIDFAVTGTINLASALPNIASSMTIEGPGAELLTVRRDSTNEFRIFNVTATGTVQFSGLTISNGLSRSGGGILNFSTGTVNVTNSILSGNRVFRGSGGGICNTATGTVSVTNSTIVNNETDNDGEGGGLSNLSTGTVVVTDATFSGNQGGEGAAIFNDDGTVIINNTTISDNEGGFAGGIFNGSGIIAVVDSKVRDNLANSGGGIVNLAGTLTLTNSTLDDNSSDSGGGILNRTGTVNITRSTISNNDGRTGGAIYNTGTGTVNVTNSTLSANHVVRGTGGGIFNFSTGIVNVSNSTISGNRSDDGDAGGIFNSFVGTVNVKSSIIASNSADLGPDVQGSFTSQGFNLIGKTDGATGFSQPTDQTGTIASPLDPGLNPNGLQDNGGPTQTIALLSTSLAIDKGIGNGLTTDQRSTGFPRTLNDPAIPPAAGGDDTDIGAFEFHPIVPSPINAGNVLLINESCLPANGAIDPGERVTVNLELVNNGSAATSSLVATLQTSGGVFAPSAPQPYGAIATGSSAARDFSFTAQGGLSPGQTITATLGLQDGTTNLGTVSFNFTAGPAPCSFVRLEVTSSLSRADAATVVGAITVQNVGSLPANNVTLSSARLGTTDGAPLPQTLGNLAPGAQASVNVNFNNATPGSSSMLAVGGTYAAGTFGSSKRVTIP